MSHRQSITAAEVLLPCTELEAPLEFYIEEIGFRIEAIFPADDPVVARLSGHGLTLRLERGLDTPPGLLRLGAAQLDEARELVAPNGTPVSGRVPGVPIRTPNVRRLGNYTFPNAFSIVFMRSCPSRQGTTETLRRRAPFA